MNNRETAATIPDNFDDDYTPLDRKKHFLWTCRVLLYSAFLLGFAFGGPVLRVTAVAAAVCTLFADWDGFLRHSVRLLSFGVAVWAAPFIGGPLGDFVGGQAGLPTIAARAIGMVVAGLVIMFVLGLLGRGLGRLAKRNSTAHCADHLGGMMLGMGEGVLIVATGCWLLATLDAPLEFLQPQGAQAGQVSVANGFVAKLAAAREAVRNDPAGRLFTRVNPIKEIPAIKTVSEMAEATTNPEALASVRQAQEFKEFVAMPEVKKHLDAFRSDKNLQAAIERRDIGAILGSDQFSAMMRDEKLHEAVVNNWSELRAAFGRPDYGKMKEMAKSLDPGTRDAALQAAKKFKR